METFFMIDDSHTDPWEILMIGHSELGPGSPHYEALSESERRLIDEVERFLSEGEMLAGEQELFRLAEAVRDLLQRYGIVY